MLKQYNLSDNKGGVRFENKLVSKIISNISRLEGEKIIRYTNCFVFN